MRLWELEKNLPLCLGLDLKLLWINRTYSQAGKLNMKWGWAGTNWNPQSQTRLWVCLITYNAGPCRSHGAGAYESHSATMHLAQDSEKPKKIQFWKSFTPGLCPDLRWASKSAKWAWAATAPHVLHRPSEYKDCCFTSAFAQISFVTNPNPDPYLGDKQLNFEALER